MMHILRRLALAALLTGLLPAALAAQQKDLPFVEWRPVQGAAGYLVQVRDAQGKVLVEQRVVTNRLDLDLPPGKYQQRIAVINKFQKPAAYSDWTNLELRVATPATVQEVRPAPVTPDAEQRGERAVVLRGDNFNNETKVFVETRSGKVEATRVEVKDQSTLVAAFDSGKIEQGKHDVIVENPRNRVTRIDGAVSIDQDKKLTAAGTVNSDRSRNVDKPNDPGKDPGREPGKEPPSEGRPLYPEYKPTDKRCGKAGNCVPASERFTWNMRLTAFVPGLTQVRAGDRKGYAWMGVLGAFAGAALYEDRRADNAAKSAASEGLGPVFSSPLVFATYSYWSQPAFLAFAADELTSQRNLRRDYRRHIYNRNILLGSAVILYGFQIIDAALAGTDQRFNFKNPSGTGPLPMQANLANSSFTWKFSRDVWVPGRVRLRDNSFFGKATVGGLGALGGLFLYETYESNRLINSAIKLREAPLNQLITSWTAPFTAGYWSNPGFLYAVGDNNRQYRSLRRQFTHSRQRQFLYGAAAVALYTLSVLDAASYTSERRFFDAAEIPAGTNPLPMADMYCGSGPCLYSPASDASFKFTSRAFVPGGVRRDSGFAKTGTIIFAATAGTLAVAAYEHYETERLAKAANRLNGEGFNALFSNSLAFAGTYSYWTDTTYALLFADYYRQLRQYSRAYKSAEQTRNILISVSAAIYLGQFLDAGALQARRTAAAVPASPAAEVLLQSLHAERSSQNSFEEAQARNMFAEKRILDARVEYQAAF